jgi:DNA-directed RNA polymerase subunit M/transcription elongation factor TFIIS
VTALPRRMYKDPAEQLLDAESETCKGCSHREVSYAGAREYCGNPQVKQLLADKRCEFYEEAV